GQAEWRETFDPYGQGRLGCMPFPIEDMILPGETKKLHLYEARFLALFEEALKLHGGCSVGRVRIEAITGMEPYISVIAKDYHDQRIVPAHSDEQANNNAIVEDILKLHSDCV
ncbi:hypothetical protein GUITHDRAFT_50701, partial [Guillardia theta CCMP2712]